MRKVLTSVAILALVLSIPAALAGEAAKQSTVEGWITDSFCGKNNANAGGKDCVLSCAKKGAKLVLYADGKTFQLSDQKLAMEHVGHEVAVTGSLDADTIKVTKIEAAKKKA